MSPHWMPLYVGDYLADTRRLSTLEHGAYLLLIMEYWQHGGLPSDEAEIADIAGLSAEQWEAARPRLSRLFKDGWRHKRIDEELLKAAEISERRKASAGRRWAKRDANALHQAYDGEQELSKFDARAGVSQPQSQPQGEHLDSKNTDRSLDCSSAPRKAKRAKPRSQIDEGAQPDAVDIAAAEDAGLAPDQASREWGKFVDYHRSRGSVMADWRAAWRTWCRNAVEFMSRNRSPPQSSPRSKAFETSLPASKF
jgi:uncharacterized protein YdaU (DUF1376 family)